MAIVERRRYKRYPAVGQAEFWAESTKTTCDLLDVAKGRAFFAARFKFRRQWKLRSVSRFKTTQERSRSKEWWCAFNMIRWLLCSWRCQRE